MRLRLTFFWWRGVQITNRPKPVWGLGFRSLGFRSLFWGVGFGFRVQGLGFGNNTHTHTTQQRLVWPNLVWPNLVLAKLGHRGDPTLDVSRQGLDVLGVPVGHLQYVAA